MHTSHQKPHGLVPETSYPGLCPLCARNVSCSLPAARCQVGPPYSVTSFERHLLRCNRTALCKGVLRARISQDVLSCRDYSPFPRAGDRKPNGRNVRMDWEQLFLFCLSGFFPCHCELRGHSTALA